MTQSIPALASPTVLQWARESVGLSTLAASRKLSVSEERVIEWEAGTAHPTVAKLREIARVYKRPLGVFFLSEPPAGFDVMRDFRRHHGTADGVEWSPELHGEYRRALTQRQNFLELAELEDVPVDTTWRIRDLPSNDDALAATARATILGASPLELPPIGRRGSAYEHLNTWVAGLEFAGVMVAATARGGVKTDEMRAFSLYFEELPVIVVNGSDSPRGRLFSLMHEYAHLLLSSAGLCDMITDARATTPNRLLEARCNAVAAAMLMPADLVLTQPAVVEHRDQPDDRWTYEELRDAAVPFGVSAEAFLRRLSTLGEVSVAYYRAKRADFLEAYDADENQAKPSSGNWYRNTARDLGKAYVRRIADAHRRRVIDSYTAATYLDVKVSQIDRLAENAALRATA